MVARGFAALLGCAAVSLATAVPAQAAAFEPKLAGSVTASSGTLRATCDYDRLFQIYDYSDTAQITGVATGAPGSTVRITCTVTPRFGSVSVSGSGISHAAVSRTAQLHGGPTTICVYATATHIIPLADDVASACATYQD